MNIRPRPTSTPAMLTHVTFTGWDDRTDYIDLANFCRDQRPGTVEIAVLLSTSRMGEDRYPGFENAVSILTVAKAHGQRAAVHLCGAYARNFLQSAEETAEGVRVTTDVAPLIKHVDRIQANVPEGFLPYGPYRYRQAFVASHAIGRPVIVQTRDPVTWPIVEHFAPGANRMVQFLFDRSGGRGQLAEQVPPLTTFQVGYAGGLGPDNVDAFVRRLMTQHPGTLRNEVLVTAPIWIDMESGIRESMSGFPGGPRPLPGTRDEPATVQPTYVSVEKCRQVMDAVRWALMPE